MTNLSVLLDTYSLTIRKNAFESNIILYRVEGVYTYWYTNTSTWIIVMLNWQLVQFWFFSNFAELFKYTSYIVKVCTYNLFCLKGLQSGSSNISKQK